MNAASSIWQWVMNFFYITGRPNFQNDRIWSLTPDEITDEEHHRELIKGTECVGVFVLFTARQMIWVIKLREQSWDGDYFWEKILMECIIPFLQDAQNVVDITQITFLHSAWKRFKPWTFWRTTTSTSLVMKSGPVILQVWMPVKMLDPPWWTRLKKGCALKL